jgi:hypothetical protein
VSPRPWSAARLCILALLLAACRGDLRRREAREREAQPGPAVASLGGEAVVALDSGTVARIGLRTSPLALARYAGEVELPAVVVPDPGASTVVRAGIGGRLSETPEMPWPRIGQHLTAGTLIAQVGDAPPLAVPHAGTVARLLAQPGELVQSGQPLLELTDYTSPLARVAWSVVGRAIPPSLSFRLPSGTGRFSGRLQGASPEADSLTGLPGYLYRLERPGIALRPGVALVALLPEQEGAQPGVEIPEAAVVQWDALAWAYVERAPNTFARVRVPTDHPVPGGWLVRQGFAAGGRVVTVGAGQLLSEEFRARIVVGEEVGE